MKKISPLVSLIPLLMSFAAFSAIAASDSLPLPSSVLKDNLETFEIDCPNNPQQTTVDLDDCMGTKRAQVEAIESKYVTTARQLIANSPDFSKEQTQKILDAFDAENKAWDTLIATAAHATEVNWDGGTVRAAKATDREIKLIELRVHNQWQNWLRYEDSTPPALPEPKFKNVE
ncbi:hypothetical protein BS639_22005 [Rouxiella silvae]|uniref:Lysozyme inhibitor LprI N-terminal domain-containing protein n=1 Tax=Rouxiella silvae TaxID=1646373 RepID=A0AA40X295_9GAMM|nr:hypothetical protein [Rouxiella silvae]KQN52282.1 hypothetical protein ASE93_03830 [Serratia sp. Leaf50]MBF6637400.1 hypothetical protein [Rouxiella silvae]ORJ19060.1 hypothetical protein BS639_22005 [Rouxiella silvae]